jgi:hypothetical protein
MNRRQFLLRSAAQLAALTGLPVHATTRPARAASASAPELMRCVSMRVLRDALTGHYRHATCTRDALLGMGFLARVDGWLIDRQRPDIVLVGIAGDPARPPLRTADWVHAMRSATYRYLDEQRRYSPPGVSIDPQPGVVQALMRFDASGLNDDEPRAAQAAKAWGAICEAPQSVRPFGLQREGLQSQYLRAITVADETMKSYVDGTLDLAGLEVPSRVMLARHEAAFRSGSTRQARGGFSMSRYWFNTGDVRCGIDPDVCVLLQCDVRLSTEAQMLARRGLIDSSQRDDLADRCAASFTRLLPRLAMEQPIYRELFDIYRTQAIAVSMAKLHAEREAGLDLGPLLDGWTPPQCEVPAQVPGRWAVRGADFRAERPDGYAISRVRIPSCGGVNVNPQPVTTPWRQAPRLARALLGAPAAQAAVRPLYWDVPREAALGRA